MDSPHARAACDPNLRAKFNHSRSRNKNRSRASAPATGRPPGSMSTGAVVVRAPSTTFSRCKSGSKRLLTRHSHSQRASETFASQSVKPKSSWRPQSLSALVAARRERKEEGGLPLSAVSSWDDSRSSDGGEAGGADSADGADGEAAVGDTMSEPEAGAFLLLDEAWETMSDSALSDVSSVEVVTDASSVENWRAFAPERQRAISMVERDLVCSDSVCTEVVCEDVTFRSLSALSGRDGSGHAAPHNSQQVAISRAKVGERARALAKKSRRIPRRWEALRPGAVKKRNQAVALDVLGDSFLMYQASVVARQNK